MIVFACYPKIVSQNEKKKCLNILKFYPIRASKQLVFTWGVRVTIRLVIVMTIKDWDGHPVSVTAFSPTHVRCIKILR